MLLNECNRFNLHVQDGVKALAVLDGVILVLSIFDLSLGSLFLYLIEESLLCTLPPFTSPASFTLLDLVLIVMMFYGAHSKKRAYLMPWMIYRLISIAMSVVIFLFFWGVGIAVLSGQFDMKPVIFTKTDYEFTCTLDCYTEKSTRKANGWIAIGTGFVVFIFAIFETYLFTVVKNRYTSLGKNPEHAILKEEHDEHAILKEEHDEHAILKEEHQNGQVEHMKDQ